VYKRQIFQIAESNRIETILARIGMQCFCTIRQNRNTGIREQSRNISRDMAVISWDPTWRREFPQECPIITVRLVGSRKRRDDGAGRAGRRASTRTETTGDEPVRRRGARWLDASGAAACTRRPRTGRDPRPAGSTWRRTHRGQHRVGRPRHDVELGGQTRRPTSTLPRAREIRVAVDTRGTDERASDCSPP